MAAIDQASSALINKIDLRGLSSPRVSGTTGCPKKGIDKKLLFGAAQGFNSQFLNLFRFSFICKFCLVHHLKDLDASR